MPNALTITLGGTDITTKVDMTSVQMQLAGSQEIATCEFDIVDTGNTVSATDEQTLSVTEVSSSTVLFGGFVRSRRVVVITTGRIIHITAVDYNSLLDRSIVVSDSRTAGESDHTRLVYLMTTYGTQFSSDYTQIATLNASMPAQKFVALTLRQAIERVLGQASTKSSYYCDPTGRLVTYDRTVVTAAPFNVRVGTPSGGELAPETFSIDNDASNLANAIYIVGATAAGSGWFTDTTSISTYGRRERFFNAPDADTHAKAMQVGLAVLEDQKNPVPRGVFTTQSPKDGWRIGQSITINSTQHGLTNAVYRVARVTVRYNSGAGDRDYSIEVGAPLPSLSTLLAAAHGGGGGFPWHSPGGAGWAGSGGVVSSGSTGGTVSGGSSCACTTPYGCVQFDNFNRTVAAGSWGTSDFGLAWTFYVGDATHFSVNGSAGVIRTGSGGGSTSDKIQVTAPTDVQWAANGYQMNARFTLANYIPLSSLQLSIYEITGTSLWIDMLIGTSASGANPPGSSAPGPGYWGYRISGDVNAYGPAIAWSLGSYLIKAVSRPGVDLQVKIWKETDTEPATFTVVANRTDPFSAGSKVLEIDAFNNDDSNVGHTYTDVKFDYIDFCPPPNSGQPYPWTNLGAGNSSQTAFSTLTPFRAGSLEVRVDTTTTTPTAQTATTGAFTLAFPPSSIEYVWARWVTA